ncbi:Dehydrogenase/reductase SDR family member on chromosome X, partial [Grifola frondosa]
MPSLSLARAANATFSPSYFPVAIFVGGTSGVGQGLAQAFARYTKGNAHIILIGCNPAAAESIIASFPKPKMERAQHEFVQCDVSLMRNIQATTEGTRRRRESTDGWHCIIMLDGSSYMTFCHSEEAKDSGEDAKAMTTLSPIAGGAINLDNLGLKKRYTAASAGLASPTYNDLMVESFAEQCPNIAFTHIFPGIVRTPLIKATHWALRPFNPLFGLLLASYLHLNFFFPRSRPIGVGHGRAASALSTPSTPLKTPRTHHILTKSDLIQSLMPAPSTRVSANP